MMTSIKRSIVALLGFALLVTGVGGCSGDDKPSRKPSSNAANPSGATTPGVQIDGSYQLGTLLDPDAAAALKVAVETLPVAVSFDYRSLDASLKAATATMTPSFAEEFSKVFDGTTRDAIRDQTIQSSLVRGAGVVDSVRDNRVTCLIYLNQVLVASKFKKPNSPLKVLQNRVRVKMQKIDGTWKVDGIEPF